jgi:hypothetical protein
LEKQGCVGTPWFKRTLVFKEVRVAGFLAKPGSRGGFWAFSSSSEIQVQNRAALGPASILGEGGGAEIKKGSFNF